ncbi:hypothetical protein ADL27_31715, partial [Streptomyces sp. NRRL F-6602]
ILICDERDHPYERPPLSKGYLLGSAERDSVFVHEPAWYAQHDVELHLGATVAAIDRAARTVRFGEDGTTVRYDKLLLATGARAAAELLPGLRVPRFHSVTVLHHAAPAPPPTGSALVLDADRSGPVAWSAALSEVDPSRAPHGRALISSTVLD